MELNSIYTELIMTHNESGHNKKILTKPHIVKRGFNPSCGDDITIALEFKDDKIVDGGFSGHGCAISQASASMMIDLIKGKTLAEAKQLANTFIGMIKREVTEDDLLVCLDDAIVFKNISTMPARVKCAVLGWHTAILALEEQNKSGE